MFFIKRIRFYKRNNARADCYIPLLGFFDYLWGKECNMKPDIFESPDYFQLDDLLTEEHKLVRQSAREWVKRSVSPIIEDYAQRSEFPRQILAGLAEIGAFGPYIPQ